MYGRIAVSTLILLAVALAAPAASSAQLAAGPIATPNGNVLFTKVLTAGQYSWSMTGMPDIDQIRTADAPNGHPGLPNQGSMWCVPTTGMNILAYLAGLGFSPGVASKDWTAAANYDEMTAELDQLGDEMDTDPQKGTGGQGYIDAMTERLDDAGVTKGKGVLGSLQQISYSLDPNWQGASVREMALAGLDGSLVAAGIGFYADENAAGQGAVKRRTGGHFMTAVGASGSLFNTGATIQVRDPATPSFSHSYQSAYATNPHAVVPITRKVVWKGNDNKDHYATVNVGTWDGSQTTLFEGYYKVVPTTYWVGLGKDLVAIRPYDLLPGPEPDPLRKVYDLPGDQPPIAVALSAASTNPAVLLKGGRGVLSLNPVTGQTKRLGNVAGARALAFGGPEQTLFVASARKLVALDGITHKLLASRKLSAPVEALAFDEQRGRLIAADDDRLRFFDVDLKQRGLRRLPAVQGSARLAMAVGPEGGLALSSGKGALTSKTSVKPANRLAALKRRSLGDGSVKGLAIDDAGRLIVARAGRVQFFGSDGRRLRSLSLPGRADSLLAMTRSFTNVDPELLRPTLDFLPGPPPAPLPPPPPPPPLADLIVITTGPRQVAVRNQGTAAAGPFTVSASSGATTSFPFAGLAAGATSDSIVVPLTSGQVVTADAGGQVAESNETNNTLSVP